jgi:hypothetical protein
VQLTVIFKGKSFDDRYQWENAADELPKQLVSVKNQVLSSIFPKVNQYYIIRFKSIENGEMINPHFIAQYYQSCSLCKVEKKPGGTYDFLFKTGKYKELRFSELAASFPYNPELERNFVAYLEHIGKSTKNSLTRNNVHLMFNSGKIKYCTVFGYNGSVVLIGKDKIKGMDVMNIKPSDYLAVRHRLEWCQKTFISPITFNNCEEWIKYLDLKFK